MTKQLLSALFAFLVAAPLLAQTPDKTKLDQFFGTLEANNKFMGNVTLSKDGKTVYHKSLGYADVDKKLKVNENTKFRIGSISKTFTAALIFKAIEEKKLTLADKLDKYFPTVPNAPKITIAQLLSHSTGIHNFTNDESYLTWNTAAHTEAQLLDIIVKGGSDFEPGSQNEYSNSNYVLLSYILEKTYKKSYKEIVDQKIVKPLGLKNTYFGGKINTTANEANSYTYNGTWNSETETDMSVPLGAGAMVSTTADLSRFLEALFAGKVVSAASFDQMKTITNDYGMGIFRYPFLDKEAYGHTGGIDGFKSMVVYFPEDKLTYAFTSNGTTYNKIGAAVISWYFNKPFEIPDFTAFAYKTEDLDKYLGVYASKQIPLKITVSKDNALLIAQATGQSAFPLDPLATANNFKFEQAGLEMEFNPETKQMVLKQAGAKYTFTKE